MPCQTSSCLNAVESVACELPAFFVSSLSPESPSVVWRPEVSVLHETPVKPEGFELFFGFWGENQAAFACLRTSVLCKLPAALVSACFPLWVMTFSPPSTCSNSGCERTKHSVAARSRDLLGRPLRSQRPVLSAPIVQHDQTPSTNGQRPLRWLRPSDRGHLVPPEFATIRQDHRFTPQIHTAIIRVRRDKAATSSG